MKGKFKWITFIGMLTVLLLILGACGQGGTSTSEGSGDEEAAEESGSSGEPKMGGEYIHSIPANPDTLDPHKTPLGWTHYELGLVYNRLVEFETDSEKVKSDPWEIVPDLAEEWEVSDDGMTFTFHLREAYFHDIAPVNGRQVNSEDVIATFDRIQTLPGVQKNLISDLDTMEAPDDQTVVFNLKQPSAPFLHNLANHYMWILPKEAIDGEVDLDRTAIGTGPFIFDEWENNVHLKFVRNSNYFEEGKPYLDAVTIRIINDSSASLNAYRTNNLDGRSEQASPEELAILEKVPELELVDANPGGSPIMTFMNMEREPFDNLLVRRAVNLAIDSIGMVNQIYGDGVVGGPISAGLPSTLSDEERAELQPYDPEKAKELLAEAGYPDGFDVTMLATTMYGDQMVRNAQWLVEDLAAIGINVDMTLEEAGAFVEKWSSKNKRASHKRVCIVKLHLYAISKRPN